MNEPDSDLGINLGNLNMLGGTDPSFGGAQDAMQGLWGQGLWGQNLFGIDMRKLFGDNRSSADWFNGVGADGAPSLNGIDGLLSRLNALGTASTNGAGSAPANNGAGSAPSTNGTASVPPAPSTAATPPPATPDKPADPAPADTPAAGLSERGALSGSFAVKSAAPASPVGAGDRKIDYVIGDSLAWMAVRDARYPFKRLDGDTEGGRPPENIVYAMNQMLKRDPHVFEGRIIMISTGASNDVGRFDPANGPQRLDQIREEMRILKEHGAAAVIVLGVGPGKDDNVARIKGANGESGYNDILKGVVDESNTNNGGGTKFIFGGPAKIRAGGDNIHPDWRDWPDIVRDLSKQLNEELPLPIHGDPGQPSRVAAADKPQGPGRKT